MPTLDGCLTMTSTVQSINAVYFLITFFTFAFQNNVGKKIFTSAMKIVEVSLICNDVEIQRQLVTKIC